HRPDCALEADDDRGGRLERAGRLEGGLDRGHARQPADRLSTDPGDALVRQIRQRDGLADRDQSDGNRRIRRGHPEWRLRPQLVRSPRPGHDPAPELTPGKWSRRPREQLRSAQGAATPPPTPEGAGEDSGAGVDSAGALGSLPFASLPSFSPPASGSYSYSYSYWPSFSPLVEAEPEVCSDCSPESSGRVDGTPNSGQLPWTACSMKARQI